MSDDFHPDKNLPGCMMPDGGECCAGHAAVVEDWHKQRREIDRLTAERDQWRLQAHYETDTAQATIDEVERLREENRKLRYEIRSVID